MGISPTREAVVRDGPSAGATPAQLEIPPTPARKSFYIVELDGLRGLAALFAVTFHYLEGPRVAWHSVAIFRNVLEVIPLTVDTFFILSGFLIGSILLRSKESPNYYKTFYLRRFHRILPLYYLWVVAYGVVFFVSGEQWGLSRPPGLTMPLTFAAFFVMLQNVSPAIIQSSYMMAPTWTLAIEEHFYLLAPLCVRRLSKRFLTCGLLAIIVIAPGLRALVLKFMGNANDWSLVAAYIWTPLHADALAMGVLLSLVWSSTEAREWLRRRARPLYWNMLPLFVVAGFLAHFGRRRSFAGAAILDGSVTRSLVEFSSLLLMIFVMTRPDSYFSWLLRTRFLQYTGRISYCLYLVHWGILWMVSSFVFHAVFGVHRWLDVAAALIGLPISYGLAALSWKFFEGPLVRRAHQYKY
jgi:peptidoglycan/LPS O-acetylase OafA/YrhL